MNTLNSKISSLKLFHLNCLLILLVSYLILNPNNYISNNAQNVQTTLSKTELIPPPEIINNKTSMSNWKMASKEQKEKIISDYNKRRELKKSLTYHLHVSNKKHQTDPNKKVYLHK